jgi:hypothetical protein
MWRWSWKPTLVVAVSVSMTVGGGIAIAASLTKGPIPLGSNGALELKDAPNFVSVVREGKIVGYVPRSDLIDNAVGSEVSQKIGAIEPVYGSNLVTLVGHLYPGIGFVRLGSSPKQVACEPIRVYEGSHTWNVPCSTSTVVVPELVGEYTPTAAATLSRLGLFVRVVYAYSKVIARGDVITVSSPSGTIVHARSVEVITSSIGPSAQNR